MRSYIQTDSQIARPASGPRNKPGMGERGGRGEGEGNSLSRFVRHARKVVAGHLFRSSRKYRAQPATFCRRCTWGEIGLFRARRKRTRARRTCTRGRVHLFAAAQPPVYQFPKGYSRPARRRRRSSQHQDNRDKWPVIRRSLKTRTFLRITRERAAPKIDFQSCAATGIRFAYFAHPLQSLGTEDSTRTEIRRRCSQIKRNAGSERDRELRRLAKVENGRSEFGVKETEESKSPDRPRNLCSMLLID